MPVEPGSGAGEFLGVALSYSDVYGSMPTWEKVSEALAPYSIERIVDVVSRLGIGLNSEAFPWDGTAQRVLCQGIFSGDTFQKVVTALERLRATHIAAGRQVPLLAINEQQLFNLLKVAFLLKDLGDRDSGDAPDGIGRALLMVGTLASQPGPELADLKKGTPEFRDAWLAYILANSMFGSGSLDYLSAARSFELYLTEHKHLAEHPSYVSLPDRLMAAHGLTPEVFWSALFALASKWSSIPISDVATAPLIINRGTYFSSHFNFSDEEAEHFFTLCTRDAAALQTAIRKEYSIPDIKPFHLVPFAEAPLVAFENRIRPLSVRLLEETLTRGLHYRYLNPTIFSKGERQRYFEFAGLVFEDYVHRTMERMYPASMLRYVRTADLVPKLPTKSCDGILIYDRSVVLLEAKASLFSADARAGGDIAAIRARLGDILVDAISQLSSTIETLERAFRDTKKLLPQQIDCYYPVIVTLEDIATTPLLYSEYLPAGDASAALQGEKVRLIQCLSVQDLENIERIIHHTNHTFQDLLNEKVTSPEEREDSWRNFLYRRRDWVAGKKNEYLSGVFKKLGEGAIEFFRESESNPQSF